MSVMDTINTHTFTRAFFPRLPEMVRADIKRKVEARMQRTNPSKQNLQSAACDAVRFGLKQAAFIENQYPFVDYRKKAKPHRLSHAILMSDAALSRLAEKVANENALYIANFNQESLASDSSGDYSPPNYLQTLLYIYKQLSARLSSIFILPPSVNLSVKCNQRREQYLESALLKLQSQTWLEKRLLKLRAQYIEYTQIALHRVGKAQHQTPYISPLSFSIWQRQQREANQFVESMVVFNEESGEHYDLQEVVKRTTANPENRRIEMMVRSRGFEELAQQRDYTALFITWTLPSRYHRNSQKWSGASVKQGHKNLMAKWKLARALIAKNKIDYFGFRVAEPHKDGTSHIHFFLFCSAQDKAKLIDIMRRYVIAEDKDELGADISKRFDVKECNPALGSATAYIAKYIAKNINGNHMPETEAEQNAYRARAWASTHGIQQFRQFGGQPVTLWRNLRRAKAGDTLPISPELEQLRQAADSSKWSLFCQLAKNAKVEYEQNDNQYGEPVRRVIGFSWLGQLIETAKVCYRLVRRKDLLKYKEKARHNSECSSGFLKGGARPWSTENNCNPSIINPISALEKALMTATGWSRNGVQCLIQPLKQGAKVPIDQHATFQLVNNTLRVT